MPHAATDSATLPDASGVLASAPCSRWCCGDVTLYHGDCRAVLPTLEQVDAVITDPPYGIYKHGGKWGKKAELYWDKEAPDVSILLPMAPIVVMWGGNYFPLPPSRGWLSWWKPDRVPSAADMELAWTNQDMNARQISWSIAATNAERVGHPTQKPVRVMSWTMEQVKVPEGALVLDPFMGSGTTAIACLRTGRRFIGIERDEKHFETAKQRIIRELDQGRLALDFADGANDQVHTPRGVDSPISQEPAERLCETPLFVPASPRS